MRTTTALASLTTAALLGPLAVLTATPASAAVEETRVQPGALTRGAAPAVPVVHGRTLVHEDRQFTLPNRNSYLLGRSGSASVVLVSDAEGDQRVLRIEDDGDRDVLLGRTPGDLVLAEDGSVLVETRSSGRTGAVVRVIDATSGELLHRRRTAQYPTVLAADSERVFTSTYLPNRTEVWRPEAGTTKRISEHAAYHVDLGEDRIAWFDEDPFDGGCTVVASLSDQDERWWRSCREAVVGFSPSGRMATVHLLSDGIGPVEVWARRARGALVGHYRTSGYFGAIAWETGRALLLDTVGRSRAAVVRCVADQCERATATRRSPRRG